MTIPSIKEEQTHEKESEPIQSRSVDPTIIQQTQNKAAAQQASVGNATYGAAITQESLSPSTELLSAQTTYGNAAVTQSVVSAKTKTSATTPTASALIVEDDVETVGAGQMKKSDFLAALRTEVCKVTAEALAGTPWSEAGCPYIDSWFGYYAGQRANHIDQAARRYVGQAGAVTNARDYIPLIGERVRQAVGHWAKTGRITGVPAGVPMLPGMGGQPSPAGIQTASSTATATGAVLPKANSGGLSQDADPQVLKAELGDGRPLSGEVQSRMGSAFGQDFSKVRLHTDNKAERISADLNARAFTVGEHIAFGSGEYQPGTLVGDAIIAHELTHVMQQRSMNEIKNLQKAGGSEHVALEEDADRLAIDAVLSLFGGKQKSLAGLHNGTLSALRSGLRLQLCSRSNSKEKPLTPISEPKTGQSYDEWLKNFPEYSGSDDRNITSAAPAKLKDWIVGKLGVPPDCADVSLLLRHYYLQSQNKTFTFKAGPKGKRFKIGHGVNDEQLRQCMLELGTINFQEDRKDFRLVGFYKKNGTNLRNLKGLINAGLKPGDLLVWKRLSSISGNFEGHVQTVQAIDTTNGLLTVVQGNMSSGIGVGQLQQRQRTFKELTGTDDGNADIKDATEESFFGAGPWKE